MSYSSNFSLFKRSAKRFGQTIHEYIIQMCTTSFQDVLGDYRNCIPKDLEGASMGKVNLVHEQCTPSMPRS